MAEDRTGPAQEPGQEQSPFATERALREVARWLAARSPGPEAGPDGGPRGGQDGDPEGDAGLQAEVEAFLDEDYEQERRLHLAEDPREMAQELAFQALEAEDGDRAWALAERALALDPRCVDALALLAVRDGEGPDLVARLEEVLAVAEADLDPRLREGGAGFWQLVAARPHQRVLKQLAELLWDEGRRLDAVAGYERLLALDPEDRQGNDRLLLTCYLCLGELGRTGDLLARRRGSPEAFYAWAEVLARYLEGGPEAAEPALEAAGALNPRVEPLMARREPLPEQLPVWYAPGTEDEAVVCAYLLGPAWAEQPEALWWLRQRDQGQPGEGRRPGLH